MRSLLCAMAKWCQRNRKRYWAWNAKTAESKATRRRRTSFFSSSSSFHWIPSDLYTRTAHGRMSCYNRQQQQHMGRVFFYFIFQGMKEIRNQRTPPCKKIENVNISLKFIGTYTISRRRVYRLPLASSLHLLFLLAVEQQSEKGLYFCLKRIVAKQHTHKNKRKKLSSV